VCFKYQPEDDAQSVETYSWLTYYFYKVVFLRAINLSLFILQHKVVHKFQIVRSRVFTHDTNECTFDTHTNIFLYCCYTFRRHLRHLQKALHQNLKLTKIQQVAKVIHFTFCNLIYYTLVSFKLWCKVPWRCRKCHRNMWQQYKNRVLCVNVAFVGAMNEQLRWDTRNKQSQKNS